MPDAQGLHSDTFDDIGGEEYAYGGNVINAAPMVTGADYDITNVLDFGGNDNCHFHMFGVVILGIAGIVLLYKVGVRGIAAA